MSDIEAGEATVDALDAVDDGLVAEPVVRTWSPTSGCCGVLAGGEIAVRAGTMLVHARGHD
ncbi:hypothetical protein OG230_02220 [Streptomyces sp. NBC_00234]|uniref:hypothetical protein n=1 Tax=Streptomyces sp. NBC_00234 TaxID=2903638 RepID=UPI002E2A17CB|nr:hypothetical protein [Streptomyces sp. NBC_00234]